NAREWDREMSKARKELNWGKQIELAIDPEKAKKIHDKRTGDRRLATGDTCTMCGEFCAYKVSSQALKDC
ncbi:MAG: phosphomethylpyrimidine synthase ThiC, partial [Candidatus Margulisiibacteriota bacterium]